MFNAAQKGLSMVQKEQATPKANLLPETGFVRIQTILSIVPVCRNTWWNGVRDGRFPKPVKLGPNITAWRAEDIRALIAKAA